MRTDDAAPGSDAELFQLDRSTCLALLTTQHIGRLVIGGGDEPHIVPVNYLALDGTITFRTSPGTVAASGDIERVVFEVDMFDDRTRSGWSVIVHGRLVAVPTDGDHVGVDTWAPGHRDQWMVVPVDAITGRLLRGAVDRSDEGSAGYL